MRPAHDLQLSRRGLHNIHTAPARVAPHKRFSRRVRPFRELEHVVAAWAGATFRRGEPGEKVPVEQGVDGLFFVFGGGRAG
jgi:hypothetical protein